MKKTFVTVILFVAMAVAANAASRQLDQAVDAQQTAVTGQQSINNDESDIFRTHAMQSEEADKHIIRFYDIDRIVIKNEHHAIIRIYDEKWQLIEKTNGDVDRYVRAGNYYVTCSSRITSRYLQDYADNR
ncbi:MAG: hypothetical protein J6W89_05895 [Paludibacteraceae bacterium]|nr:hypothetical protein [Paludibacteraceae bacterium]